MGDVVRLDIYNSFLGTVCSRHYFLIFGGSKIEKKEETVQDSMKKRYVRGEISKDECEENKKDLV